MALWFRLRYNDQHLGTCVIQRTEHLDLSDPASADAVCTYTASIDGGPAVLVEHRYGDGAWELVRKALEAVARKREQGVHLDRAGPDVVILPENFLTEEEADRFAERMREIRDEA